MNTGQDDNIDNQNDDADNSSQSIEDINIEDINMGDDNTDSGDSSDDGDNTSAEDNSAGNSDSDDSNEDSNDDDNSTSDDGSSEGDNSDGGTSDDGDGDTKSDQQDSDIDDDYNEEEAYLALSEETGVEVSSDDDVIVALKELASLRQNNGQSNLSKTILSAIEVEKNGGDLASHFQRIGMDFDKMDAKEVLRQKFLQTEAKLNGTNPKLAQAKFERDFSTKYGKWVSYQKQPTDEDKAEFAEENGQEDIDYEKMVYENDVDEARKSLNAWKESAAQDVKQSSNSLGMTDEEAEQYANDYAEQSSKAWGDFESVAIPMGEGLEDYTLGLNETTKPIVEGWVEKPDSFLKDIGFDGKSIDVSRLLPVMTVLAEVSNGNLGGRIAKYAVDSENVDTLKKNQDKPRANSVNINQDRNDSLDDWGKIGKAAEEARERIN